MPLNKLLASIAFVLAVLAAFIGAPQRNNADLSSIAMLIETEQDHVTPLELAGRLIAGKDLRLIDLRDSSSYAAAHITGAERMPLQQLVNGGVRRNEFIVLYSEGGIHASQAWTLLKMQKYDSVFTLLGGFAGWEKMVLHPVIQQTWTMEEQERRKRITAAFGGTPSVPKQPLSLQHTDTKKQPASAPAVPAPVQFKQEEEKLRDGC